jgi:hypothetical protein
MMFFLDSSFQNADQICLLSSPSSPPLRSSPLSGSPRAKVQGPVLSWSLAYDDEGDESNNSVDTESACGDNSEWYNTDFEDSDIGSELEDLCDDPQTPSPTPAAAAASSAASAAPRKSKISRKRPLIPIDKDKVATFVEKSHKIGMFYTGLKTEQREVLWRFLGKAKSNLAIFKTKSTSSKLRTISVRSQFLLTLLILRRGRKFQDAGYQFELGARLVGRVFKTWIQFMYHKFLELKDYMFVRKCDIKKPLPEHFNNNLCRECRVVIDCTEIFVENSSNFRQQGNLFSTYKKHTTVKALIGVAPSGAASFISDCFEGSMSDRESVLQSGFLDYIEKGDLVLADRGFQIGDLLSQKGATLNIPPFLKGRKAFNLDETQTTKIIAKARIHVERV